MAQNNILFGIEVDSAGAVAGFKISRKELDKLRKSAEGAGKGAEKGAKGVDKLGKESKQTTREVKGLTSASSKLAGVIGTVFALATVTKALQYADTMKNIDSRLRIATDSAEEFVNAQQAIRDIAERSLAPLDATATLYTRLELSLKGMNVSQKDVLQVTETLNKAYQVSGATAQETANSIVQLSQGLAAGALRGDEFRSVMEQAPRVVQALTDSLGLTRGELREMANDGKLTTEILVKALSDQAAAVEADFANVELTVGRAFTLLRNETLEYVADTDAATGASAKFAEAIKFVSENIDVLANVALAALATGLVLLAPAFLSAAVAAGTFILALGPLGIAAAAIGLVTLAFLELEAAQDRAIASTVGFTTAIENAETAIGINRAIAAAREEIAEFENDLVNAEESLTSFLEQQENLSNTRPDIAGGPAAAAARQAREIEVLNEQIETLNKSIKDGEKRIKALAAEQDNAANQAKKFALSEKEAAKAATDYAKAVGLANKALLESGSVAEKIIVLREREAAAEKNLTDNLGKTVAGRALLAKALKVMRAELAKDIKTLKDAENPVEALKIALNELEAQAVDPLTAQFLQLDIMLEEAAIKFGENSKEVEELTARVLALKQAAEELKQAEISANVRQDDSVFGNNQHSFIAVLGNALETSISDGFSAGGGVIKDALSTGAGKAGAIAFAAGAANQFFALNDAYNAKDEFGLDPYGGSSDGTIRALADTILPIVAMLGPWGAAIAGVIGLIDGITGGGLFGTAFKSTESRREFNVTDLGGTGGIEIDQKRKKSFFRGTARRTVDQDLSADGQRAVTDLFNAAYEALLGAVQAVGAIGAEFVEGAFKETFDADGNLVSSISTVLGRTYEETFEEFSQRLVAEQILSALIANTGEIEVNAADYVLSGSPAPGSASSTPGGLGALFPGVFDGIGEGGTGPDLGAGGDALDEATILVNEVNFIAERWRDDAKLLLEGAQFLLIAQASIQEGVGLFDTLLETADIVEELRNAGETMTDTFARLVASTMLVEDALDLLDVSLDLTRNEFVRFSDDFVEAAGGLQRAGQLWGSYFSVFFEADELLEAQLRIARNSLNDELGDIGLDPGVSKEEFKALFEDVLPTLSAEALVEWLEAADALGLVLDLEGQLSDARVDYVQEAIDAFEKARGQVGDILGDTIQQLKNELLSDPELYGQTRGDALKLADSLTSATSREEVLAIVAEIDALTRDARGIAGDTRFNPELIEFLEQVGVAADAQLLALEEAAVAEIELRAAETASREQFTDATATFSEAVETFAGLSNNPDQINLGTDSETLTTAVIDGLREGLNPELMAETTNNFVNAVNYFGELVQFQANNPIKLEVSTELGPEGAGNEGVGIV